MSSETTSFAIGQYPSSVRATRPIEDEGRPCAKPGDVGVVLYGEHDQGEWTLTVAFPDAPCSTTCFLGWDVELAPTVKA